MRAAQQPTAVRMVVQLTEDELLAHFERHEARIAELIESRLMPANDGPLDRQGAANWLHVSLAKLDQLVRNEGVPFYRVGDCKRFFIADLETWVRAQKKVA